MDHKKIYDKKSGFAMVAQVDYDSDYKFTYVSANEGWTHETAT